MSDKRRENTVADENKKMSEADALDKALSNLDKEPGFLEEVKEAAEEVSIDIREAIEEAQDQAEKTKVIDAGEMKDMVKKQKKQKKTSSKPQGTAKKTPKKSTVSGASGKNGTAQKKTSSGKTEKKAAAEKKKSATTQKKSNGTNTVTNKKSNRKKQRKKEKVGIGKKILIGLVLIVVLMIGLYVGVAYYFSNHFFYNTKVNGIDCSFKDVSQVESYLADHIKGYTLSLKEADNQEEIISGDVIGLQYVPGDSIKHLLERQNVYLWVTSLFDTPTYETEIGVSYDEQKLTDAVNGLNCMNPDHQVKAKKAHPKYEGTQYVIDPEVKGTEIETEVLTAAVKDSVNALQTTLDLTAAGCYKLPKYTSESPEVIDAVNKLNSYLGAKITYETNSGTETVDGAMIAKWLKYNDKMEVSFKKDDVQKFIATLARKCNTVGQAVDFTTADGDTVKVEGGSFGRRVNQDKEYNTLIDNIKQAKVVTRTPVYSQKPLGNDSAGVGDTYAEVDLTDQKMWFIKDGKVVLESDVVTGNPNKGNATPQGIYTLSYKQKDKVLRGDKQPDGTYAYESPVTYWMPFNGGIGFHDASWQSSFGGERYKTNGSHGCINMPLENAKTLYGLISAGTPVVCHY